LTPLPPLIYPKKREQVAAEYETKINEMKQAIKGKLLAKIKEV